MALRHKARFDPDPQVRMAWQLDRIRQAVEFIAGVVLIALILGVLGVLVSVGSSSP